MVEQRQTQMAINRMSRPVARGPVPATGMTLTPKDIWGIIRRHILLIIFMTILGFVIGGISWFLLLRYAPKYTAQAYIEVLPPIEKDPTKIGGAIVQKELQYSHRVSLASLIKQQSTLEELLRRDTIQETEWFNSFGKIKDVKFQKAFKKLKKKFGVFALRDGDYISLSMTCSDKTEAALIVNEMLDMFISSRQSTSEAEVAQKLAGLRRQHDEIQSELQFAEQQLDGIRNTYKIVDIEEHTYEDIATLTLNNLTRERDLLLLEIQEIQTAVKTLEEQVKGPVNEQVQNQIENDPVMVNLAQILASLKTQLGGALTKFGENHRQVRRIQEIISQTESERQIRKAEIAEQTRRANLMNARDALTALMGKLELSNEMLQEAEAEKRNLDAARVQYAKQLAIRDERKEALDNIKADIDTRMVMLNDPETPKVKRMGYAPEPREVSSPLWYVYFPGGTFLGFMFGIGLAFLIELLNDLVRTPRDVGRYLHVPLLGVIPDSNEDEQTKNVDLCHVVRQAPYSITSESYRRLRTHLKLSGSARSSKVILISSGMAGDGKTSVAVNLATTLTAENKKVLLIDANFWQPGLHKIFPNSRTDIGDEQGGEESDFGLSTFLAGLCGYHEAIRFSGFENLDIIDSGPLPSNPTELLGGEQMKQLVKHQRQSYDYVIVDGPPVLLVSDVKVLARLVDGTILIFNAAATRRGVALRTIRELREISADIIGCVLLAVQPMKGGYFSEQFKSYQEYSKLQVAHSV